MHPNKLIHIQLFAINKLKEFGLFDKGWRFVWDKSISRYGQCRYNKKEIGISKKLTQINEISESEDTVLHELAHALVGSGHGHDNVWKKMCVKIGAKPERCYKDEDHGGSVKSLKPKYIVVNKDTGEVYCKYHRRPKIKDWSTRWIGGKKAETYGKLELRSTAGMIRLY